MQNPDTIELMRQLPSSLRPNQYSLNQPIAQAHANGWTTETLIAALKQHANPTINKGGIVLLLRELAAAPPTKPIEPADMKDIHQPLTKWSWCKGCTDPFQWIDNPQRGNTNLCHHHRFHADKMERANSA